MPRKSTSPPFLGRAWDLIAFCKVRKPLGRKLSLFKKGANKRFRLLRHYNYAFIGEYQYSPSSSPLFNDFHPRPPPAKKKCRFLTSLLICGGNVGTESVVGDDVAEVLSTVMTDGRYFRGDSTSEEEEEDGDCSVSVDWRAEKFIERFYEEMRLNHRRSSL